MTFNQIKYFVTVAECLSFTEAAKCLFITQPGAEPSDQCYGGRTGNQTFYPGEKTSEADTGRQCAITTGCRRCCRIMQRL